MPSNRVGRTLQWFLDSQISSLSRVSDFVLRISTLSVRCGLRPFSTARSLLAALAFTLVVSCAHVPDREPGTDTPHPGQWQAGTPVPGDVRDVWWREFNDAHLNGFIAESLTNNYDLQAAAARVEIAQAEAAIAGADLFPSVGVGANAERSRRNYIGLPIPGGGDDPLTTHSTTYGLSLNTSWELDLWGRIRSGKRAAQAQVEASRDDLQDAQLSLAGQTAKTWLAVVEAREQVNVAQRTLESFTSSAEQIRDRYERGIRPPLDLRLALANVAGAEAALDLRQVAYERAVRQLDILVGRYPAGELQMDLVFPAMPGPVPAGLPSEMLVRRPDLRASEQRLRSADWRVAESKATLLPRLSLTASGGTTSEDLADLVSADFKVWTLAGNLAQPLFEGGRLRAGVRRANARAKAALAEYRSTVLLAFSEVESALVSESLLARREDSLNQAVEQSRAALNLAELRYGAGLDTIITVLEAQRRLFEAETQQVAIRRQRLENRVDLHLALGGGFNGRDAAEQAAAPPAAEGEGS